MGKTKVFPTNVRRPNYLLTYINQIQVCNGYLLSVTATTPSITDCPSFVGPTVVNRTQIEFYCDIRTSDTDPRARFNVTFLFSFVADNNVPVQVLTGNNRLATLHERYLAGRLNKVVRLWISAVWNLSSD